MTGRVNKIAENGGYQSIDEFMEELLLVFENATIYNEPGSTIYQDALILHKVAIDSLHLVENGNPSSPKDRTGSCDIDPMTQDCSEIQYTLHH